jgi:hypothetical protein
MPRQQLVDRYVGKDVDLVFPDGCAVPVRNDPDGTGMDVVPARLEADSTSI